MPHKIQFSPSFQGRSNLEIEDFTNDPFISKRPSATAFTSGSSIPLSHHSPISSFKAKH